MNNTLHTSRHAHRAFSARTTLAAALVALACSGCAELQQFANDWDTFAEGMNQKIREFNEAKNRTIFRDPRITAQNRTRTGVTVADAGGVKRAASGAQSSYLEAVKRKVAAGADKKALRKELSEVLHADNWWEEEPVVVTDRLEAASFLLDNGVGINQKNEDNQTPLEEALEWLSEVSWKCADVCRKDEDSKIAMLLVSRGANMNILVRSGGSGAYAAAQIYHTALGTAVDCGSTDLVRLMLEKGANVNAYGRVGEYEGESRKDNLPLLNAVSGGAGEGINIDIVKLLLDKGAKVNARDGSYNWTPVMWAANFCRADVVQLLIGRGANINAVSINKETALAIAQQRAREGEAGCEETIMALKAAGAKVSAASKKASTKKRK